MATRILPPAPHQYMIDAPIIEDLLHQVEPSLEDRPEAWTRGLTVLVQPGLELLLSGFCRAWQSSPNAQRRAMSVLAGLAVGKQPERISRRRELREMVEGYRLAIKSGRTGEAAARLFASNMLGGLA